MSVINLDSDDDIFDELPPSPVIQAQGRDPPPAGKERTDPSSSTANRENSQNLNEDGVGELTRDDSSSRIIKVTRASLTSPVVKKNGFSFEIFSKS